MDFDWLQLTLLFASIAVGYVWASRRLDVSAGKPVKAPLLGLAALLSFAAFAWSMLTIPSEDGFLLAISLLPIQLGWLLARFFRYHKRQERPVPVARLVAGNALVLALLLSVAFWGGEVWFRFAHDTTDSIGYTKLARRWLERHYELNNYGFRDNVDYQPARTDQPHRVTFLGDSFTVGHGIVDVEQRIPNRLRSQHPDWDVHVLAKNGDDTASQTDVLHLIAEHNYQLDEVVLAYCLNDVIDLLPHWREKFEPARIAAQERFGIFDSSYLLDMAYYRVAIARLLGAGDYFSFVGEAYQGTMWEQQKQRLRDLRKAVEDQGGRLSVVTWPFLNALDSDYAHTTIHDTLAAFWQEEGVQHLDLLPHLRDHAPEGLVVNSADAHPNERANELAAEVLGPWLEAVIRTPRSK